MECCSSVFTVLKLTRVLFMLYHACPFRNEPYRFCYFPFSRAFGIMIESLELYGMHGQMRTITLTLETAFSGKFCSNNLKHFPLSLNNSLLLLHIIPFMGRVVRKLFY